MAVGRGCYARSACSASRSCRGLVRRHWWVGEGGLPIDVRPDVKDRRVHSTGLSCSWPVRLWNRGRVCTGRAGPIDASEQGPSVSSPGPDGSPQPGVIPTGVELMVGAISPSVGLYRRDPARHELPELNSLTGSGPANGCRSGSVEVLLQRNVVVLAGFPAEPETPRSPSRSSSPGGRDPGGRRTSRRASAGRLPSARAGTGADLALEHVERVLDAACDSARALAGSVRAAVWRIRKPDRSACRARRSTS